MKCFFLSILGATLIIIMTILIIPEVKDYRAQVEVSAWLVIIKPIQKIIEEKAIKNGTLQGAGVGIKFSKKILTEVRALKIRIGSIPFSIITERGLILLKGGINNQLIVLIPSINNNEVTWRLIGSFKNNIYTDYSSELLKRKG